MNKPALILGAVLCLARPARAGLELVGGPPRSFGGGTVTRSFRLEAQGAAEIEWRTRILRGIIERGSLKTVGPGDVIIELKLPVVRARVEMIQEVQVRQKGKVIAAGEFPMELFPEGLAAPAETPAPVLGVIDDGGALAAFMEKAGWRVVRLAANLQYRAVGSKVVLVAADQADSLGEPMSGLDDFLQGGGTVIFLDQSQPRKNLFDPERRWEIAPGKAVSAEPVVKSDHRALLDLKPGDVSNWRGSGGVAAHAIRWDDWPWQRAWLAAAGPDAAPLVTEYWGGKGRVIRCQLDMGARLESEPAAQILLRNLVYCAMSNPAPTPVHIHRFAIPADGINDGRIKSLVADPKPEALKDALAVIAFLSPDTPDEVTSGDFEQILRTRGAVLIQSPFGDEMLAFVNRLSLSEGQPTMKPSALPDPLRCQVDYTQPLTWGIPSVTLDRALTGAENLRFLTPDAKTNAFRPLTQPPILSQFTLGKARIVLCALPLDDPENEDRNRIVGQVLANLADRPKKPEGNNVK